MPSHKRSFPLPPRVFFIVLLCLSLAGVILYAAADDRTVEISKERLDLGKPMLCDRAADYQKRNLTDSALITYTAVVSYLNPSRQLSHSDAVAVADAFLALADIHYKDVSNEYLSYPKAYSYFQSALDISRKYNLQRQLGRASLGMGILYQILGSAYDDTSQADTIMPLFRNSFELARNTGDTTGMCMAALNIAFEGFNAMKMKENADIVQNLEAMPLAADSTLRSEQIYARQFCRACLDIEEGHFGKADTLLQKLKRSIPPNSVKTINVYSLQADADCRRRRLADALDALDTAAVAAASLHDLWIQMQVENGRADLYEGLGQKANAEKCRTAAFELRRRMLRNGSAGKIKDLHFLNQIDHLNTDLRNMALEKEYTRNLLIIIGVAAVVFAILLGWLALAHRSLRQTHRHIFEAYTRTLKKDSAETECPAHSIGVVIEPADEPGAEDVDDATTATPRININEEEQRLLLDKIVAVLENQQYISNPRFRLRDLSEATETSPRLISQIINDRLGCNFASLLAEYRIKAVCRNITESPRFRKLTIEAMAETAGFQSRSYFSTVFKKITGLSPSEFIKQANRVPIS